MPLSDHLFLFQYIICKHDIAWTLAILRNKKLDRLFNYVIKYKKRNLFKWKTYYDIRFHTGVWKGLSSCFEKTVTYKAPKSYQPREKVQESLLCSSFDLLYLTPVRNTGEWVTVHTRYTARSFWQLVEGYYIVLGPSSTITYYWSVS